MKTGIIVLSAGESKRLGQPKQELEVDGIPMLQSAVLTATASKAGDHMVVVSGANFNNDSTLLDQFPVKILKNKNWEMGIGSSIKEGLKFMMETINPEAVILMVIDQPFLNSNILNDLINTYKINKSPVVASRYKKTLGTPALFDRSLFHEVLNIPDDKGALEVILNYRKLTKEIPFPGGDFDIDTMEDYRKYKSRQGKF